MTALSPGIGSYKKFPVRLYAQASGWAASIVGWRTNGKPRPAFSFWPAALFGIVITKAVLSIALKPDSSLIKYGGIPYFLLLFLAAGFALRNGIQNTLKGRPFWVLLSIAYNLWVLDQWIYLYYDLGLHMDVPDNSIADPVLFLHVAFLLAAVATLPHRNMFERKQYGSVLNTLLIVIFWGFLYFYVVFPHQLFSNATGYALGFDTLYPIENWSLILALAILSNRASGPWKSIYFHLLGASALYAVSSAIANLAIDSGGYINGKLYGVGLTAAVCWFAWIPLRARQLCGTEVKVSQTDTPRGSKASTWAMIAVVLISIPVVWELSKMEGTTRIFTFRLLVAIVAIVCLAGIAFLQEHLAKSELTSHFGFTNDSLNLERKRAEQVLRESENRFRLVANAAPVLIWMSGTDGQCTFFNQGWLKFTGRTLEEELGVGWASAVHPEDREKCLAAYAAAFDARSDCQLEYRLRRSDGEYRWLFDYSVPRFESDDTFRGYIGSCMDITDRKESEASLHFLTGRLISAQEEEKARIARELHDDFSQRLALLGIGLGQLWKRLPNSELGERSSVKEMLKAIREMSSDMHALSHQLHSSKLEHVGLVPAISALCREIGQKHRIALDFEENGFSLAIPKDIALCLFRVAQEALMNVVKHSKARNARVELCGSEEQITLRVLDYGRGFDPGFQNPGAGIGLIGMTERLRLVRGKLTVNSAPNRGTEIIAEVTLAGTEVATRANAKVAGR
jgi:PAS domain S-box-containing protein